MPNQLFIQFILHHRLYNNVLDGFTDADTNMRPYGDKNVNHIKYLYGHLLNSQYGLAMIAGLKPEVKWNDLFAVMGKSKARDDINYPVIKTIQNEWNVLYEPTRNGLSRLTDSDLSETPLSFFEQVAESKGKLWAFINHHTAYHIGQISILRKTFGKSPMRYQ